MIHHAASTSTVLVEITEGITKEYLFDELLTTIPANALAKTFGRQSLLQGSGLMDIHY